jgi:excisionase family DNA binding protein
MANGDVLTIKELSEHLRVHPTTIYRLVRDGRLPAFRVGSNWRFSRSAVAEWTQNQGSQLVELSRRGRGRKIKTEQFSRPEA